MQPKDVCSLLNETHVPLQTNTTTHTKNRVQHRHELCHQNSLHTVYRYMHIIQKYIVGPIRTHRKSLTFRQIQTTIDNRTHALHLKMTNPIHTRKCKLLTAIGLLIKSRLKNRYILVQNTFILN